ncbi:hypothetical protein BTO81_005524, partial [Escherichia coli]|nr:hypothetical protein [Escherichia coli]EFF8655856.1 hypothetical protein [Escherichia coli]
DAININANKNIRQVC